MTRAANQYIDAVGVSPRSGSAPNAQAVHRPSIRATVTRVLGARRSSSKPALSISRGLERDRGADENGNQIAVFGRVGSRPLNSDALRRLYVDDEGKPWFVENQ